MSDINRQSRGGIDYSEAEKRTVKRINAIAQRFHGAQREIGKIVDDIVAVKGGPAYGESTLDRLSKHPALACSREQLRRCWQYYRLSAQYGKELEKTAPSLKFSHLYQISRLLDIEDEQTQRGAVLAMARKAADEHMTATAIADAVSTHLKSLGKAIRGKLTRKSVGNDTKEVSENDAYNALIDTSETVVMALQEITNNPKVGRVAELKLVANRLGFSYVQLVAKLFASGDEDITAEAQKVIAALAAAVESAVTNEGGTKNDSN